MLIISVDLHVSKSQVHTQINILEEEIIYKLKSKKKLLVKTN